MNLLTEARRIALRMGDINQGRRLRIRAPAPDAPAVRADCLRLSRTLGLPALARLASGEGGCSCGSCTGIVDLEARPVPDEETR